MVREMMQKETRLSSQQIRAIDALIATGRQKEAAEAAGVTRTTLYRWLKDPVFLAAVHAAEGEALENVSRSLLRVGDKAVRTLESVMDSTTAAASVRVKAADVTLARMVAIREIVALDERLSAIEQRLANLSHEVEP